MSAIVPPTDIGQWVDFSFAKAAGRRLVSPGPKLSGDEITEAVADLRSAAAEAVAPVSQTARMSAPEGAPSVLVVDRGGWIDANSDSMAALLAPVVDKIVTSRSKGANAVQASLGSKITGAEVGALLAFLSSKILGQYDLAPKGTPRLLLVAPNIVQVERQLGLVPRDFRRWVAMHEETHRVQFTAVPWLREHVIARSQELATELAPTPDQLAERFKQLTANLPEALSGSGGGLAEVFATPEQKAQMANLTAVMSLLEGHADVVMDDVGPQVIPTVAHIRASFDKRRKGAVGLDRLLRRLLGLDAKMRQYRDGAVFVRGVIDQVGIDRFNTIWTAPETLPTAAEILEPSTWVQRVNP